MKQKYTLEQLQKASRSSGYDTESGLAQGVFRRVGDNIENSFVQDLVGDFIDSINQDGISEKQVKEYHSKLSQTLSDAGIKEKPDLNLRNRHASQPVTNPLVIADDGWLSEGNINTFLRNITEDSGGRVKAAGAMGKDVLDLSQVKKDFQEDPQLERYIIPIENGGGHWNIAALIKGEDDSIQPMFYDSQGKTQQANNVKKSLSREIAKEMSGDLNVKDDIIDLSALHQKDGMSCGYRAVVAARRIVDSSNPSQLNADDIAGAFIASYPASQPKNILVAGQQRLNQIAQKKGRNTLPGIQEPIAEVSFSGSDTYVSNLDDDLDGFVPNQNERTDTRNNINSKFPSTIEITDELSSISDSGSEDEKNLSSDEKRKFGKPSDAPKDPKDVSAEEIASSFLPTNSGDKSRWLSSIGLDKLNMSSFRDDQDINAFDSDYNRLGSSKKGSPSAVIVEATSIEGVGERLYNLQLAKQQIKNKDPDRAKRLPSTYIIPLHVNASADYSNSGDHWTTAVIQEEGQAKNGMPDISVKYIDSAKDVGQENPNATILQDLLSKDFNLKSFEDMSRGQQPNDWSCGYIAHQNAVELAKNPNGKSLHRYNEQETESLFNNKVEQLNVEDKRSIGGLYDQLQKTNSKMKTARNLKRQGFPTKEVAAATYDFFYDDKNTYKDANGKEGKRGIFGRLENVVNDFNIETPSDMLFTTFSLIANTLGLVKDMIGVTSSVAKEFAADKGKLNADFQKLQKTQMNLSSKINNKLINLGKENFASIKDSGGRGLSEYDVDMSGSLSPPVTPPVNGEKQKNGKREADDVFSSEKAQGEGAFASLVKKQNTQSIIQK
jgi:hypothetical protein